MQRDSVGAASGLKLSYAGLTNGFTALRAAMLGAAEREGLTDALRAELARSQPNYLKHRPALPANRRVNLTLFCAANSNKVRSTAPHDSATGIGSVNVTRTGE
jgi:hypothetical protein